MDKNTVEQLKSYIERVERLTEEKQDISNDIKDVLNEAKSHGYDVPTIKEVIKLRKKSKDQISEEEYILHIYLKALGMLDND